MINNQLDVVNGTETAVEEDNELLPKSRKRKSTLWNDDTYIDVDSISAGAFRVKVKPPKPPKKRDIAPSKQNITMTPPTKVNILPKKKVKFTPPKPPSHKEKEENEREDKFLQDFDERIRQFQSHSIKSLREGAWEVPDLMTALITGLNTSNSLLLQWTHPNVQIMGHLCKIYWDGENNWFYARILNYDNIHKRHLIYYSSDNTCEWIDFQQECAMICQGLAYIKYKNTVFPGMYYYSTPKAQEFHTNIRAYKKGGIFIEYCSDNPNKEYEYVLPPSILPLEAQYAPSTRLTKAYEASMMSAQREQEEVDNIVNEILKLTRKNAVNLLRGEDWIGVRVRVSTHRLIQIGETLEQAAQDGMVKCEGTIVAYSGSLDLHYVLFDMPLLQPQWISCKSSDLDILIGPQERGNLHAQKTIERRYKQQYQRNISHGSSSNTMPITSENINTKVMSIVPSSSSSTSAPVTDTSGRICIDIESNVCCMLCGYGILQDINSSSPTKDPDQNEGNIIESDSNMAVSSETTIQPLNDENNPDNATKHLQIQDIDTNMNNNNMEENMIKRRGRRPSSSKRYNDEDSNTVSENVKHHSIDSSNKKTQKKSNEITISNDDSILSTSNIMKNCKVCHGYYHSYCLPVQLLPWKSSSCYDASLYDNMCWSCITCRGSCGKTLWNVPMIPWSLVRVDEHTADTSTKLICSGCLKQYKHDKQFCPICYKIYHSDLPHTHAPIELITDDVNDVFSSYYVKYITDDTESDQKINLTLIDTTRSLDIDSTAATKGSTTTPTTSKAKNKHGRKGKKGRPPRSHEKSTKSDVVNDDQNLKDSDSDHIKTTGTVTSTSGGDILYTSESSTIPTSDSLKIQTVDCSDNLALSSDSNDMMIEESSHNFIKSLKDNEIDASAINTSNNVNDDDTNNNNDEKDNVDKDEDDEAIDDNDINDNNDNDQYFNWKAEPLDERMINCNECDRWVHALCEGLDETQYLAIGNGTHPVWGDEYLCPHCRIKVSQDILEQLCHVDSIGLSLFAYPVTEAVAANYFDIIRSPMDLQTMSNNSLRGHYKSVQSLRQHWELMLLNAFLFNKTGDEYWLEAKRCYDLGLLVFNRLTRKSTLSAYGQEIQSKVDEYMKIQIQLAEAAAMNKKGNKRKKGVSYDLPEAFITNSSDNTLVHNSDVNALIPTTTTTTSSNMNNSGDDAMAMSIDDTSNVLEIKDDNQGDENIPVIEEVNVILPTILTPSKEPFSFVPYHAILLTVEDAYYQAHCDQCMICGSSDDINYFLFCIDCGEVYHSYCVDVPIATMGILQRTLWRCSNCKVCEICGISKETDATTLIYCDQCDRSYHMYCVIPSMTEVPTTSWYCHYCVTCQLCHGYEDNIEGTTVSDGVNISNGQNTQISTVSTLTAKNSTTCNRVSTGTNKPTWGPHIELCQRCIQTEISHRNERNQQKYYELLKQWNDYIDILEKSQLMTCHVCNQYIENNNVIGTSSSGIQPTQQTNTKYIKSEPLDSIDILEDTTNSSLFVTPSQNVSSIYMTHSSAVAPAVIYCTGCQQYYHSTCLSYYSIDHWISKYSDMYRCPECLDRIIHTGSAQSNSTISVTNGNAHEVVTELSNGITDITNNSTTTCILTKPDQDSHGQSYIPLQTHVGTLNQDSIEVLHMLSKIQRMNYHKRKRYHMTSSNIRQYETAKNLEMDSHRLLHQAILMWGIIRIKLLHEDEMKIQIPNNGSHAMWLRGRANRFLTKWKSLRVLPTPTITTTTNNNNNSITYMDISASSTGIINSPIKMYGSQNTTPIKSYMSYSSVSQDVKLLSNSSSGNTLRKQQNYIKKIRSYFTLGRNNTGDDMSIDSLSSYSVLSAAFLELTRSQIRLKTMLSTLNSNTNSNSNQQLLAPSSTSSKKSSLLSNNLPNIFKELFFYDIQTVKYYETCLPLLGGLEASEDLKITSLFLMKILTDEKKRMIWMKPYIDAYNLEETTSIYTLHMYLVEKDIHPELLRKTFGHLLNTSQVSSSSVSHDIAELSPQSYNNNLILSSTTLVSNDVNFDQNTPTNLQSQEIMSPFVNQNSTSKTSYDIIIPNDNTSQTHQNNHEDVSIRDDILRPLSPPEMQQIELKIFVQAFITILECAIKQCNEMPIFVKYEKSNPGKEQQSPLTLSQDRNLSSSTPQTATTLILNDSTTTAIISTNTSISHNSINIFPSSKLSHSVTSVQNGVIPYDTTQDSNKYKRQLAQDDIRIMSSPRIQERKVLHHKYLRDKEFNYMKESIEYTDIIDVLLKRITDNRGVVSIDNESNNHPPFQKKDILSDNRVDINISDNMIKLENSTNGNTDDDDASISDITYQGKDLPKKKKKNTCIVLNPYNTSISATSAASSSSSYTVMNYYQSKVKNQILPDMTYKLYTPTRDSITKIGDNISLKSDTIDKMLIKLNRHIKRFVKATYYELKKHDDFAMILNEVDTKDINTTATAAVVHESIHGNPSNGTTTITRTNESSTEMEIPSDVYDIIYMLVKQVEQEYQTQNITQVGVYDSVVYSSHSTNEKDKPSVYRTNDTVMVMKDIVNGMIEQVLGDINEDISISEVKGLVDRVVDEITLSKKTNESVIKTEDNSQDTDIMMEIADDTNYNHNNGLTSIDSSSSSCSSIRVKTQDVFDIEKKIAVNQSLTNGTDNTSTVKQPIKDDPLLDTIHFPPTSELPSSSYQLDTMTDLLSLKLEEPILCQEISSTPRPLQGWNNRANTEEKMTTTTNGGYEGNPFVSVDKPDTLREWKDMRICGFCHAPGNLYTTATHMTSSSNNVDISAVTGDLKSSKIISDPYLGRLLPTNDGQYYHINCIRWSDGVIERKGVLEGSHTIIQKVIKRRITCAYCRIRGASITCAHANCNKYYHLKCALACQFTFFETKAEEDASTDYHPIYTLTICPEHYAKQVLMKLISPYQPWIPHDPLRMIQIDASSTIDTVQHYIATQLNESKGDLVVKCGTITILNIGNIHIHSPYYHTESILYPLGFQSIRIYWSMIHPLQRTTYLFDVISEASIHKLDIDISDYSLHMKLDGINTNMDIQGTDHNTEYRSEETAENFEDIFYLSSIFDTDITDDNGMNTSFNKGHTDNSNHYNDENTDNSLENDKPIFRVFIHDQPHIVLLSRSIDLLYHAIVKLVELCWITTSQESKKTNSDSTNTITNIYPINTSSDNSNSSSSSSSNSSSSDKDDIVPNPTTDHEMAIESPFSGTHIENGLISGKTLPYNDISSIVSNYRPRHSRESYGLLSSQFFGLTLPYIKETLESNTDSVMAMTSSISPYKPSYILPSSQAYIRLLSAVNAKHRLEKQSIHGAARADPYEIHQLHTKRVAMTRILTKIADNTESEILCGSADKYDISITDMENITFPTDDIEDNIRAQERLKLQYHDLFKAYLIDPCSKLCVKRSSIHGWGLFAKVHFSKDDMIVEYIGEKIRQVIADRREIQYEQEGVGSCYLFRLDKDTIVDATRRGGMARFINHRCEPNAYARVITTENYDKHIIIFAGKSIQEGEEITYDYKFPIEDTKLKCYCGAPRCNGSMN